MAKRSIDTWQDTIAAERSAAEHLAADSGPDSASEPGHADRSGVDPWHDRLIEARLRDEADPDDADPDDADLGRDRDPHPELRRS